jgi:hypothetical protein
MYLEMIKGHWDQRGFTPRISSPVMGLDGNEGLCG